MTSATQSPLYAAVFAALGVINLSQPLLAQQAENNSALPDSNVVAAGVMATDGGDRLVYTTDYLQQYNASTASDLLARIPGISGLLQGNNGDQRGFGSDGDQVLINGQRVSGKSNDVDSVLDRIQARQILQIEVIRGTIPGLEVRSQGRVVNVVLAQALSSGSGAITAQASHLSSGQTGAATELTWNGSRDAFNYLLSLEAERGKASSRSHDRSFTPDRQLFEQEFESANADNREYAFTGNTSYAFAQGHQLNLNGLFEQEDEKGQEMSTGFEVSNGTDIPDGVQLRLDDEFSRFVELGGDYRHLFDKGSWTTLFIHTDTHRDETGRFYDQNMVDTSSPELDEIQLETSDSSESIVRSSYQWSAAENHQLETGVEAALNKVSESSSLFKNQSGQLEQIPFENAASLIEETRYELFLSHTWQASERLLLSQSLDIEHSSLHQSGQAVDRKRRFSYLRPRLTVSYDQSEQAQWRARIERSVSQLDFGDFVASFNDDDNRFDVINAGNPELVPETAWEYELSYEYQLPDDKGFVEISTLFADVQHHLDLIAIPVQTPDGEEIRVAPGNTGDAKRVELSLTGSLRLDSIGLSGGVIDAEVLLRKTRAIDAFTAANRRMSHQPATEWNVAYRQDLRWQSLSLGFETGHNGRDWEYELDYLQSENNRLDVDAFLEWPASDNVLVQLEAENLFRSGEERNRRVFETDRASGVLARRELRDSEPDREISLSVIWSF